MAQHSTAGPSTALRCTVRRARKVNQKRRRCRRRRSMHGPHSAPAQACRASPAKLTTAAQAWAWTRGFAKSSIRPMTAGRILACCSSCSDRGMQGGERDGGGEDTRQEHQPDQDPLQKRKRHAAPPATCVWSAPTHSPTSSHNTCTPAPPQGSHACAPNDNKRLPGGRGPGPCSAGPAPGRRPTAPWGARRPHPAARGGMSQ